VIVGAGLAGLIAAHAFPRMPVIEAGPEREMHKALLRFRSDSVAKLTGIDFTKVRVRKGIWLDGRFQNPSIRAGNLYSRKCLGILQGDRSIWNMEPVDRFIAPDSFYAQLVEGAHSRIHWETPADYQGASERKVQLISTAPLPVALAALAIPHDLEFKRAGITVCRFHVPNCSAYQTIYFPGEEHCMYRASITGETLIVEFSEGNQGGAAWMEDLLQAFALPDGVELIEKVSQSYGKIAPVDSTARKALIAKLTNDFGVYSLGRFATWRNLLLDDVVDDVAVVKRLLTASSYERRLAAM